MLAVPFGRQSTLNLQSSNNLDLPGVPTVQYLNNQHARGLLLNGSVQSSKDVECPSFVGTHAARNQAEGLEHTQT